MRPRSDRPAGRLLQTCGQRPMLHRQRTLLPDDPIGRFDLDGRCSALDWVKSHSIDTLNPFRGGPDSCEAADAGGDPVAEAYGNAANEVMGKVARAVARTVALPGALSANQLAPSASSRSSASFRTAERPPAPGG